MAESTPRYTTQLDEGASGSDDFARLSELERSVVRGLRRLDFRAGRQRLVVLHWDGVRMVVKDTEQVYP